MQAEEKADVELLAWMRFVDRLGLEERTAKRLLMAWIRLHRAYFKD